jgi:hypothetical protein
LCSGRELLLQAGDFAFSAITLLIRLFSTALGSAQLGQELAALLGGTSALVLLLVEAGLEGRELLA